MASTWTDNRGNAAVLNKLMSTWLPSSAVLMELASHLKKTQPRKQTAKPTLWQMAATLVCVIGPARVRWWTLLESLEMGRQAELDTKRHKYTEIQYAAHDKASGPLMHG